MGRILLSICAVVVAAGLGGSAQVPGNVTAIDTRQDMPVAASLNRIAKALEAQNPDDAIERERRDLNAQEDMAKYASVQAEQIVAQTPFIWAGSVAAALAFVVSLLALWVTVGTGRRQLRAYVMPDHVSLLHPTHDADYKRKRPKPPDLPLLVVHLKNFGPTPALEVLHWADFALLPFGEEDGLAAPVKLNPVSAGSVAPGGVLLKRILLSTPITTLQAAAISRGEMTIYVRGYCTYRDVFNRKRETRYLLNYAGQWPPPANHQLYYCDSGNTIS